MTTYFIGIGISFLLTRLVYINYMKSLGLEYNPNKSIKVFGREVKPFYIISDVIDRHIKSKNLSDRQIRYLRLIKKWELLNWIAIILFPLVVMISESI
jgi:hypothetical protein